MDNKLKTMSSLSTNVDNSITPVMNLVPPFHIATPVQDLQDTLEYATSPINYLERRVGPDVVQKRSHLLSIPTKLADRDMYGSGIHKQHFEQHIATLLGKEHGLFFITGVQAQLIAIKIYCGTIGNNRVAFHHLAHMEVAEERAYAEVFGLESILVGSSPFKVPTVADIKAITSLAVEERPAVMVLELPNRELGCKTYSYDELVQISTLCRAASVMLHMDGARLWEIQPFYPDKTFSDIAALFDSVYVSFYKGLRGAAGAMLTSSDESFIKEAKTWQRRMGGNMVTSYSEIIDCERGYNLNIGTFNVKWQKMCSVARAMMDATNKYRTKDGNRIVYFDPEVPTCCQTRTYIQGVPLDRLLAARDEVEEKHHISVFSRTGVRPVQTWDEMETDPTLIKEGDALPEKDKAIRQQKYKASAEKEHFFLEWKIQDENLNIDNKLFARGWEALCRLIVSS